MNTTDAVTKKMLELAQQAMKQAYAPYSKFSVGAAITDENGQMHAGCNVENAAYPLGICAEGSAISQMVVNGGRIIGTILLVSSGNQPVMPCGGCCQKIKEFSDEGTQILSYYDDKITVLTMKDLLPYAFSNQFLTND